MNLFPQADPIPLPAPVWLFKVLHDLTLALHFTAVELLLGSVLVAAWLAFRGRGEGMSSSAAVRLNAAAALGRRLPVLMTYVINFGVPPLLFAQVLYGRALYTSSVLIGAYWIGVIFLLTACYWLLYRFAENTQAGKPAWTLSLAAWLLAAAVAGIYTTNMTLMLRPEVWAEMYSHSALGVGLPPHDPAALPRWLFMLCGGFAVSGLGMIWLGGRQYLDEGVRRCLAVNGGRLALAFVALQVVLAFWVFRAQPESVRSALASKTVCQLAGLAWLAVAGLIFLTGLWAALGKSSSPGFGWWAVGLGFLASGSAVVYRDGLRDVTLFAKGFDVWQREVLANWPVVGLFIALLVAGLAGLGWLIWVMVRAKPVSEKVV
jgi:hypothetical protein